MWLGLTICVIAIAAQNIHMSKADKAIATLKEYSKEVRDLKAQDPETDDTKQQAKADAKNTSKTETAAKSKVDNDTPGANPYGEVLDL